jgi:hypothetical protein
VRAAFLNPFRRSRAWRFISSHASCSASKQLVEAARLLGKRAG